MEPFEVRGVRARGWELSDAGALFSAIDSNRAHLQRWMPWVPHTVAADDVAQFIQGSHDRGAAGSGLDLGLFDGHAIVGGVGASIGALNSDESDVGYWLAESHQGRGIASVATSRLVDWLFVERDMHRITIRAAVGNAPSRALAERLGFAFEGVMREALLLEGARHDAALYSVLRSEWSSRLTE